MAPMSEEDRADRDRIHGIFHRIPDDEMYGEVLKVILEAMDSEYGVFGYLDEDGAFVVPSLTGAVWDECQVSGKAFIFPREEWGDSSWPRAIRERRGIIVNELSAKTPNGHIQIDRHISLPIIHRGAVCGLFQVANKQTDYTAEDLARLDRIAAYTAPVLRARLERDTERGHRERAEERVVVLDKSRQKLLGMILAIVPLVVILVGVVLNLGAAGTRIKRNTNDIQKHDTQINGLATDLSEVKATVAGVDVKVDLLLEHNGVPKDS